MKWLFPSRNPKQLLLIKPCFVSITMVAFFSTPDQVWPARVAFKSFFNCFRNDKFAFFNRSGKHRVRTKTFRTSDAERLLRRAGVTRVSQSDGFCLGGVGARAIPLHCRWISTSKINIRNSMYNEFCSMCFTVRKDNCTGVHFSAVCQYFCRPI